MDVQKKRNIVIIGGGIMGCTTAYFLTRHPKFDPANHSITVLEASAVAAGASGKAGGLLALWAYPECLVPLSFRLHRELAERHGGADRWGYRRVGCGSISATVTPDAVHRLRRAAEARAAAPLTSTSDPQQTIPSTEKIGSDDDDDDADQKAWEKLPKQDGGAKKLLEPHPSGLPADLDWIDAPLVDDYREMGGPGLADTAQVHPFHFTTAMAELAREAGVDIRLRAQATQINYAASLKEDSSSSNSNGASGDGNGVGGEGSRVDSVEYLDRDTGETHTLQEVTDVVVAAGPWTGRVLPRTRIQGLRAHSVVWEADVSPYAVFTEVALPPDFVPEHRVQAGQKRRHRGRVDPEIYARPGREVYACGEPDKAIPLPDTADAVQCDTAQCDDIVAYVATVSPVLAAAPVRVRQACYLPRHMRFGEERGPLIGPTAVSGLWVAAGHTCWGIQNGPATGCLMAEFLLDGRAASADISELDPRKVKV